MKYLYSFCKDFFLDDVRDDVVIAHPFVTDPCIFGVWHKYLDATFVIAACILMLTALLIYVAHQYRCARVRVGVQTIIFRDSSDVPHYREECCISLNNIVVRDQVASL